MTGDPADRFLFRTPTLRNVSLRAPFFHNGGKQTLAEVISDARARGNAEVSLRRMVSLLLQTSHAVAFTSEMRAGSRGIMNFEEKLEARALRTGARL